MSMKSTGGYAKAAKCSRYANQADETYEFKEANVPEEFYSTEASSRESSNKCDIDTPCTTPRSSTPPAPATSKEIDQPKSAIAATSQESAPTPTPVSRSSPKSANKCDIDTPCTTPRSSTPPAPATSKEIDQPTSAIAATSQEPAPTPTVSGSYVEVRNPSKSACGNIKWDVIQNSSLAKEFVVQEFAKTPIIFDGLASTVVLGQRKKDQLDVGIKFIEKKKCSGKAELRRARAELNIHKKIPPHRNVVPALASEETPDAFLLVTPFAAAGDLWDLIKYGQTICEIEVRNCLAQVLAALCHIHGLGLIHGDMKPHNILLFKIEGRFAAQLCDFGLTEQATSTDGKISYTGLRGTSGWYAPEQIEEEDYNSSVDVFGVGLMAYRMLGGYEPFYPATCFCEPVDFDMQYFSHISKPCLNLVQQLLKLDPQQRATSSTAAQHIWFTGDPPPEPTKEMLQNLEEYGAAPAKGLCFFTPDELAKHSILNIS